jgi:hypothetical protein
LIGETSHSQLDWELRIPGFPLEFTRPATADRRGEIGSGNEVVGGWVAVVLYLDLNLRKISLFFPIKSTIRGNMG